MIVPDFWAEARLQQSHKGKTLTVRRWGWSNHSQVHAEQVAQERAQAALQGLMAGEPLRRREPKVPYNGADGLPIREEVLLRDGDSVITRNSYGAHCLNTPRVVFADVDFTSRPSSVLVWGVFGVLLLLVLGGYQWAKALALPGYGIWVSLTGFVLLLCAYPLAAGIHEGVLRLRGGELTLVRQRVKAFLSQRPDWGIRLYRTPHGLRLMVTHQLFDVNDAEIQGLFKAVGADPMYVRMCNQQGCFRARLTGKPWRMGDGLRWEGRASRPGSWPVAPDRELPRFAWITKYDALATGYSACHWVGSEGKGGIHVDVAPVLALHDEHSRALNTQLPLA